MLTLHLLGHTYLSNNEVPLKLSSKALALICYLVLEQQAQHRELLADLLWPGPSGIGNLRVELSKLRAAGLNLGATRSPMLSLSATTDQQLFLDQAHMVAAQGSEALLSDWLSLLRGTPLTGLEDIGTERFQTWLDTQRRRLGDQLEAALEATYQRSVTGGHLGSAQLIVQRAEALLYFWPLIGTETLAADHINPDPVSRAASSLITRSDLSAEHQFSPAQPSQVQFSPAQSSPVHFGPYHVIPGQQLPSHGEHPALGPVNNPLVQRALTDLEIISAASVRQLHPQAVLLSGLVGSGRSELVLRCLAATEGLTARLDGSSPPSMWLVTLLLELLPQVPSPFQKRLRALIDTPGEFQSDLIRLVPLLFDLHQPLRMVIGRAHLLTAAMLPVLGFLTTLPLPLLTVLITNTLAWPELLGRLSQQLPEGQVHHMQMPPVIAASVGADLTGGEHARRLILIQQSEGWSLGIDELLSGPAAGWSSGRRAKLSTSLKQLLIAEVDAVFPFGRGNIARMAALPSPFTQATATTACGEESAEVIRSAAAVGLIEQVPAALHLDMTTLDWRIPDGDYPFAFTSELRRSALVSSLTLSERGHLRELDSLPWDADPARPLRRLNSAHLMATPCLPPVTTTGGQPPYSQQVYCVRVPGNYHVTHAEDGLQVTRLGLGQAPTLHLSWPGDLSGPWQVLLKLDLFGGRPEDFPLGTELAGQWYFLRQEQLNSGGWYRVCGPANRGSFRLSMRATNLALTIAEIRVGSQILALDGVQQPTRRDTLNFWANF